MKKISSFFAFLLFCTCCFSQTDDMELIEKHGRLEWTKDGQAILIPHPLALGNSHPNYIEQYEGPVYPESGPRFKPKLDALPIIVVGIIVMFGGFLVNRR